MRPRQRFHILDLHNKRAMAVLEPRAHKAHTHPCVAPKLERRNQQKRRHPPDKPLPQD
jgi:hypothetical protein